MTSLNKVGGHPDHFGSTVAAFHAHNRMIAQRWPHTMLTSSTHDTKRSMEKATREAKQHTSWINPHQNYDEALRQFIEGQPGLALADLLASFPVALMEGQHEVA